MDLQRVRFALFFLTVLLLPTQLGKHFWWDFSYIYSLKIDYFSPTLYLWDLLVLGLILLWTISKPRVSSQALSVFLFFVLTQVLSLFNAGNLGAGLTRLEQYWIIGLWGIYIASQDFQTIKKSILFGLSGALVCVSLLGVLEFLFSRSMGAWFLGERAFSLSTPSIATFNFYGQVFLRPYSTFPHPNVLSAFIVLVIPVVGFLLKEVRIKALMLGFGAIAALLTFSRVSILILTIEGALLLRRRVKVLVAVLILVIPFLYVRFFSAFNFDILSLTRREELAVIAVEQFKYHPIFGVGLNNFISETATSSLVSGPSRFLQPVHNILLLSLAETGIVGTLGFFVLVGFPIIESLKRNGKYNRLMVGLFGAIFFLGMFDHYFLTLPQGQRLLFLVWGLSMLEYSGGDNSQGI